MTTSFVKPPMRTTQEALEYLLSRATSVDQVEMVSTQDALGRILAKDILSQANLPRC